MTEIKLGALLRVYCSGREISFQEKFNFSDAVRRLVHMGISDVQIEVWAERANPQADFGTTAALLRHEFALYPEIHVHEALEGDLFVAILNHGVHKQFERGVTHTLILSHQLARTVDEKLLEAMIAAVRGGACVVTSAFAEIAPLAERGMVCNSCALWDIAELLAVGGFDARDAKPRGVSYDAESPTGVGEVLPLIAIRERLKRPVHAILKPATKARYMDEVSEEQRDLNHKKFKVKEQRLTEMLALAGKSYKDLELTIMSGYPR